MTPSRLPSLVSDLANALAPLVALPEEALLRGRASPKLTAAAISAAAATPRVREILDELRALARAEQ